MKTSNEDLENIENNDLIVDPITVGDFESNFRNILKENLIYINKNTDYTYQKLADILKVSKTSIYKYTKGETVPSMGFVYALAKLLNIKVEELLSPNFSKRDKISEREVTEGSIDAVTKDYDRFLGTYSMYYFKTSNVNTKLLVDYEEYTFGFDYGLLHIYNADELKQSNLASSYKVLAMFNLESKKLTELKAEIEGLDDIEDIKKVFSERTAEDNKKAIYYSGNIGLAQEHVFINLLSDETNESVQLTFHKPPTNAKFIGGLGIVASISRGRVKDPCLQNIAISKGLIKGIGIDVEEKVSSKQPTHEEVELSKLLRLNDYSEDITKQDLQDCVTYLMEELDNEAITDKMKARLIGAEIEDLLEKYLSLNTLMLSKVSEKDDHDFYRLIKRSGNVI